MIKQSRAVHLSHRSPDISQSLLSVNGCLHLREIRVTFEETVPQLFQLFQSI